MIGTVRHAVVICRDSSGAAAVCPGCDRATLTVEDEQRRLLTRTRRNEEAPAAVIDLPRGVRSHAGARSWNGNSDIVVAGDGGGLIGARPAVQGREIAVVVGDPEWKTWRYRQTPGIGQVSVNGGGSTDYPLLI